MRKISLTLATSSLLLQNSGARAATPDLASLWSQPSLAPHPSLVAIVALLAMACLVLLSRAPATTAQKRSPQQHRHKALAPYRATFGILFAKGATVSLIAGIVLSSSMIGMA